MNIKKHFLILLLLHSAIFAGEMSIEFVFNPSFFDYAPLFEKFGRQSCMVCSGKQMGHKRLSSVCFVKNMKGYLCSLESEIQAHEQDVNDRLFLQAMFLDEVIGFMSCQIVSDYKVIIHQICIDPEQYDDNLVKDFLFAILQLVPKVQEISILCPLFNFDLVILFQDLGFTIVQQESNSDLFVQFELQVHPKCVMCQILYGPEFWENEDLDAWEQDPDQEDQSIGFYSAYSNPLSEDDDGRSDY